MFEEQDDGRRYPDVDTDIIDNLLEVLGNRGIPYVLIWVDDTETFAQVWNTANLDLAGKHNLVACLDDVKNDVLPSGGN